MERNKGVRAVLALASMVAASSAGAAVYTVGDGDTEGLAQAIELANQSPEPDLIELSDGWFLFDRALSQDGQSALPTITSAIRIRGKANELRRYSDQDFRMLHVGRGGHLILERVTLADGSRGAILNEGTLDLRQVQIVDHDVRGARGVVWNTGVLRMTQTEVSFNTLANVAHDAAVLVNDGSLFLFASRLQGNLVSRRFENVQIASVLLNQGEAVLKEVVLQDNEGGADENGTLLNVGAGLMHVDRLVERGNQPLAAQLFPAR